MPYTDSSPEREASHRWVVEAEAAVSRCADRRGRRCRWWTIFAGVRCPVRRGRRRGLGVWCCSSRIGARYGVSRSYSCWEIVDVTSTTYELFHPEVLETESVHIFREVAATLSSPALLFSGGKDSMVMLHLAAKAFWPAPLPFPVMHVDTGHNFDEVIEFRDRIVEEYGVRLVVGSVQDDIDAGRVVEETARAKERVFSFRDEFGQWDPRNQRPELWQLYNGRHRKGEQIRVFPLSNWTELDIWAYIQQEGIPLPSIYYGHRREVVRRDG